jgi:hypothetical protein
MINLNEVGTAVRIRTIIKMEAFLGRPQEVMVRVRVRVRE